jgi:hypothetical protein
MTDKHSAPLALSRSGIELAIRAVGAAEELLVNLVSLTQTPSEFNLIDWACGSE